MPRWSPDAALRLEAAAMSLFERQGFAGTTVPQIAAAAGLTTRTFFRHFADKRDVLFLRDRELPQAVSDFMESVPAESSGAAMVRAGLTAACRGIHGWREPIVRRRRKLRSGAIRCLLASLARLSEEHEGAAIWFQFQAERLTRAR